MSILPDHWITQVAAEGQMITPFADRQVREGISYGVSSYGYDFRVGPEFWVPRADCRVLDPKATVADQFDRITANQFDIPAGSFLLATTVERFAIPRDVLVVCQGKSTYARCGVTLYTTPFEPEWEGHATIAVVNSAGRPVRIYANEGMGQMLFFRAESPCQVSYADKKGKYQGQTGVTVAKGQG